MVSLAALRCGVLCGTLLLAIVYGETSPAVQGCTKKLDDSVSLIQTRQAVDKRMPPYDKVWKRPLLPEEKDDYQDNEELEALSAEIVGPEPQIRPQTRQLPPTQLTAINTEAETVELAANEDKQETKTRDWDDDLTRGRDEIPVQVPGYPNIYVDNGGPPPAAMSPMAGMAPASPMAGMAPPMMSPMMAPPMMPPAWQPAAPSNNPYAPAQPPSLNGLKDNITIIIGGAQGEDAAPMLNAGTAPMPAAGTTLVPFAIAQQMGLGGGASAATPATPAASGGGSTGNAASLIKAGVEKLATQAAFEGVKAGIKDGVDKGVASEGFGGGGGSSLVSDGSAAQAVSMTSAGSSEDALFGSFFKDGQKPNNVTIVIRQDDPGI